MQQPDLKSFRQYADHAGINVSSVSKAVARGRLPTVMVEGKRFIDTKAADETRRKRARSTTTGGSPERRQARTARWRAQAGCGYDLGQHMLLGALTQHGPRLVADAMRIVGAASEDEVARAAAVANEIIEIVAAILHDDLNRQRVWDYRNALPKPQPPQFETEAAAAIYLKLTDRANAPDYDPEEEGWWNEIFDDTAEAVRLAKLQNAI